MSRDSYNPLNNVDEKNYSTATFVEQRFPFHTVDRITGSVFDVNTHFTTPWEGDYSEESQQWSQKHCNAKSVIVQVPVMPPSFLTERLSVSNKSPAGLGLLAEASQFVDDMKQHACCSRCNVESETIHTTLPPLYKVNYNNSESAPQTTLSDLFFNKRISLF